MLLNEMPRVNCGCWQKPRPGYVNIDFDPGATACEHGDQIMLQDVREGLPFADGSVAEVRGDQFLEHLTLAELVAFLAECERVLCPGGEVRFEFPDMVAMGSGGMACHFVADLGAQVDGVPDDLVMYNLLAHEWGHKTILTLELVMPLFSPRFEITHAARFGDNALIIGRKHGADAD